MLGAGILLTHGHQAVSKRQSTDSSHSCAAVLLQGILSRPSGHVYLVPERQAEHLEISVVVLVSSWLQEHECE